MDGDATQHCSISATVLLVLSKQESLANAKVSTRQQCVYEGPSDEIYDISTEGSGGLQLCRYLHSFSCRCVQNLRPTPVAMATKFDT